MYSVQYIELLVQLGLDIPSNSGFDESILEQWESSNAMQIPPSLREYYSSVGRLSINRAFHKFLSPNELRVRDNRLEFMDENQGAMIWAIATSAAHEEDPIVVEGVSTAGPTPWVWNPLDLRCCEFLKQIMHWQIIESADFVDIVDGNISLLSVIKSHWAETSPRRQSPTSATAESVYSRPGQWIGVVEMGQNLELHVAAANEELFEEIGRTLGISLEPL